MSMESKETYTCPECGHEQECTVWHSLNGDMNPEAKQQLLDGTLFLSECSNCGRKSNLDYGILYHDMTNQTMVYYVDEESVNKTLEIMKNSFDCGLNRIISNQSLTQLRLNNYMVFQKKSMFLIQKVENTENGMEILNAELNELQNSTRNTKLFSISKLVYNFQLSRYLLFFAIFAGFNF